MAWNNEQTIMVRGLVNHYCTSLGVSVNDLAETAGINRHRLSSFANHTLQELDSGELTSLLDVVGELARAEKRDIDEHEARGQKFEGRTYQNIIAETIMQTGGENA